MWRARLTKGTATSRSRAAKRVIGDEICDVLDAAQKRAPLIPTLDTARMAQLSGGFTSSPRVIIRVPRSVETTIGKVGNAAYVK